MSRRFGSKIARRIGAGRCPWTWLMVGFVVLLGLASTSTAGASSRAFELPFGGDPSRDTRVAHVAGPGTTVQFDVGDSEDYGLTPEEIARYVPPTLLGPETGIVGTMLTPTFTWTSPKPEWDVVVLFVHRQGAFRPYVAIGQEGASWVDADDLRAPGDLSGALADADRSTAEGYAVHRVRDGQGSASIRGALAPGRYAWLVVNGSAEFADEPLTSERREFTVHGPALKRLAVQTRAQRGTSWQFPGGPNCRSGLPRTPTCSWNSVGAGSDPPRACPPTIGGGFCRQSPGAARSLVVATATGSSRATRTGVRERPREHFVRSAPPGAGSCAARSGGPRPLASARSTGGWPSVVALRQRLSNAGSIASSRTAGSWVAPRS